MDFVKIFDRFKSLNVLIIGDVMIDAYWWGGVNRISPEAPVPVCAVHKKENRLGGAANVALNISAMGANPILCSVVGNDIQGHELCRLMQAQNMDTDGIVFSDLRPTTVKTRIIGNKTQMLRIDEETDANISAEEENVFFEKIEQIINTKKINAIIFQVFRHNICKFYKYHPMFILPCYATKIRCYAEIQSKPKMHPTVLVRCILFLCNCGL
jgi:rfaE bifunctional protein kinase chain/domain